MKSLIDIYFRWPIIIDFIVVVLIWVVESRFAFITFKYPDQNNLLSLLSSLIGTMISLAGFMLAALTIIVTFKSSLTAKGMSEATNALELLFNSRHYSSVVKVFKNAIIEFVIYSILLYMIWQSYNNFDLMTLNKIVVSIVIIIAIVTLRTLYMLFGILSLENHQTES